MTLLNNDISQHAKNQNNEALFVELLGDETSGARIVIETDHARIHAGLGFDFTFLESSIASSASHYILIKPNDASAHLRKFQVYGDLSPLRIESFESPSGTDDGAVQATPVNRNRYSSIVTPLRFYLNPTVTDEGTPLAVTRIFSEKKDPVASSIVGLEWILKHDLVYLLKITNNAAQAVNYYVEAFYYHISDPTP